MESGAIAFCMRLFGAVRALRGSKTGLNTPNVVPDDLSRLEAVFSQPRDLCSQETFVYDSLSHLYRGLDLWNALGNRDRKISCEMVWR